LFELSRSGPGSANVFTKWRHQYGPIFTYWLGKTPVVCVADYQKLVETLQRDGESYVPRPEGFKFMPVFNEENSKCL
jgi:cytochrome P450 family 33